MQLHSSPCVGICILCVHVPFKFVVCTFFLCTPGFDIEIWMKRKEVPIEIPVIQCQKLLDRDKKPENVSFRCFVAH